MIGTNFPWVAIPKYGMRGSTEEDKDKFLIINLNLVASINEIVHTNGDRALDLLLVSGSVFRLMDANCLIATRIKEVIGAPRGSVEGSEGG